MRLSKLVPIIGVAGAVTAGTLAAPRLVTVLLWRLRTHSRPTEGLAVPSGSLPVAVTTLDDHRLDDRRSARFPGSAHAHQAVNG